MLTLGFEAKRVFTNYTGLGNYCRTLLEQLAEQFPENRYVLYSPKLTRNARTEFFFEHPAFSLRKISKWARSVDLQKEVQTDKIDLFHGLSHELPWKPSPCTSIVTIHDLIALLFPEQYSFVDRKIYQAKMKRACQTADHIIAISQSTKRDLMDFYQLPERKISVVYQDCDPAFRRVCMEEEKAAVRQKYELPERFLLSVGTIIERKRLLSILKALHAMLPAERIPLVVVGKGRAYREKCQQFVVQKGLKKWVYFRENITFQDLPAVYQQALIFLYPSVYEGFGIPVLEAQHSGVPVITSRFSSLPEVGGTHSIQLDPDDIEHLKTEILELAEDEPRQEQMIQEGYKYIKQFAAERTIPQLMGIYQEFR
ncbi:MAG: glycosyltransferase family 1 protein [Bacteroidota bacterium]